tara:strand:+ start:244 stop:612 length:369 start_codon:yes stop_codon:yes gene_type:complete
MADLNIPNLNKKNDKYLFKNKLPLRRKSSGRLIKEIFTMFFFSLLIFYLNYLIPNKVTLFKNFLGNLEKIVELSLDMFLYFLEVLLVIFILVSLIFALILILGSIYRLMRIFKKKTKNISYK